MHLVSLLSFGTPVAALALPHPQGTITTGNSGSQPFTTNTSITFYQGVASPAGTSKILYKPLGNDNAALPAAICGVAVGVGTIHASYCTVFHTAEIGVKGSSNGSCSLTLYAGSTTCSGGMKMVLPIPNGEYEMCVGTGVLDGGQFQKSSGIWACG